MPTGNVITIGNFDGVHLGHRAILDGARALADRRGAAVKVVTFEPHPATVLRPDSDTPRITDTQQKKTQLLDAGADQVIVLQSSPEVFSLEPQAFVEQLVGEHHPLAIVEGANFRFGKGRRGDVALLRSLGQQFDFEVVEVEQVEVALSDLLVATVSSSLVRWLVLHGRVADAARCLGRAFDLTGTVIEGDRRGQTIGIPTANLDQAAITDRLTPADGVYGGFCDLADDTTRPAAVSIGVKPTFKGRVRTVEAHLIDFDGDLYGQTMTIRFTRWLRDQRPFAGPEALRSQLDRDVAEVRRLDRHGMLDWPAGGPGTGIGETGGRGRAATG